MNLYRVWFWMRSDDEDILDSEVGCIVKYHEFDVEGIKLAAIEQLRGQGVRLDLKKSTITEVDEYVEG